MLKMFYMSHMVAATRDGCSICLFCRFVYFSIDVNCVLAFSTKCF